MWEGNGVNTEGVRWKMYETCRAYRYSKRSSVACHLADLPLPGVSIQWQFLPTKVPLWNTWIGGFRWFHLVSSNIPFQVWYSNCEQTFEGRGYYKHPMASGVCPCSPSLKWPKLKSNQTGSMYINLLDLDPLAAIDPKNSGVSAIFHTICFQK